MDKYRPRLVLSNATLPHRAACWYVNWFVWKLFFFRFSCLIVQRVLCYVSTLLFIPCDPLSTDSLVGVLLTSPEKKKREKNSLTGKKRSSHLQYLSQEFGNMTPAKAFRGLVSNVVIFGWLENKAGWEVDKVPEWLWQEAGGGGSVRSGSGLGLGQPAAGLAPGLTRKIGNLAGGELHLPSLYLPALQREGRCQHFPLGSPKATWHFFPSKYPGK